jgi:hypothetical protein
MNIIEAQKEMRCNIEAGIATLLVSGSGMGKSSIMLAEFEHQKAEGAKKGERWGLGIIFLATQTPPDLIGYQFKGEKEYEMADGQKVRVTITDPSVPLWMLSVPHGDDPGGKPAFLYDKFFLIIDEYGQGEPDTKRAAAEIFLKGGTAPWYLPAGSVRVAATNEGSRYGVSKDFDFCVARRGRIAISPDIEPLLQFMDKPYVHQGKVWQTSPVVKFWAKRHPEIVFEAEPKEQGPWCMPRTLCDADRYLQVKARMNGGTIPTDASTIETLSGIIGMPATTSLVADIQFRLELPSYEDVIKDPANTPVPDKPDMKMLMAYEMAHQTQVNDLAAVVAYLQRFPKDMAVTYVTSLLRRDYRNFINSPAMQGWIAKNAALVSVISSLAQN